MPCTVPAAIADCNSESGSCKTQGEEEGLLTEKGVSIQAISPAAGARVIRGARGLTGETKKRPCLR